MAVSDPIATLEALIAEAKARSTEARDRARQMRSVADQARHNAEVAVDMLVRTRRRMESVRRRLASGVRARPAN